jgi:uncharacterized delta-60 repeat protein
MKAKQPVRSSWTSLGIFILPLIGAGVFWAFSSSAQSTVDGSWFTNGGGTWGTRTSWSYSDSLRPAAATTLLNQRAVASATRLGDAIVGINVTFGGVGYTTPPIVIIGDPGVNGRPARALAQLDNGVVNSIVMVDSGAGYTAAPTVTLSGEVDEASISEVGSGYASAASISFNGGGAFTTPPTVTFRGGIGSGAEATAVIGTGGNAGKLISITVNNGGIGYSTARLPTVQIITTTGGTAAAATAIVDGGVDGGSGVITGFTITNQGSAYGTTGNLAAPSINIVSPTPTDVATGTVVIEGGRVIDVEIINPGTGYTTGPQVIFTGGGAFGNGNVLASSQINEGSVSGVTVIDPGGVQSATATAVLGAGGGVSSIALTYRGLGYTSNPAIVIGAPLIVQATVASSRTGNMVNAVAVTSPGAGYLVNPAVTFANTGWQGYTAAPRVKLITGSGAVATAARNVSTQVITTVSIQDPGQGYTIAPTVSFMGGGGTGATATATLTSGRVTGVTVTGGGTNYTSDPLVVFTSDGITGAQATATIDGVSSVVIGNGGSGYATAPTVSFVGGGGSGATATANVAFGALTSITMTNAGSGYTSAPTVNLAGGGGSGAVVTAAMSKAVSSVIIGSRGSGYTTAPVVSFVGGGGGGSGAAATATVALGVLTGITMTNVGSGYAVAPSVVLTGGGGTGATATAFLSNAVTSVKIANGGSGYTVAPTVSLVGGNGSGATATAVVEGEILTGVSVATAGSGYGVAPTVNLIGGGGTGAIVTAVVSGGQVTRFILVSRGSGYTTTPTVIITPANPATATATLTADVVTGVTIRGGGAGYTSAPRVVFSSGITGAQATAVRNATSGAITSVTINDAGLGYSVAPTLSFLGGNGTGAAATSSVSGGLVTALNVTAGGTGYGGVPTLTFSGGGGTGATATAIVTSGIVTGLTLTNAGSGYTTAPGVYFAAVPVANSATATATISAGKVTLITMTNGGSGYTSAPTVAFTAGGVTFAVLTALVPNGQLSGVTVVNGGSGYVAAPTVFFEGGVANGGVHGTATALLSGGTISGLAITSPGGAVRAVASSTRAADGGIESVTVTNPGTGYIVNPIVTLDAPTGITTPVQPVPGGIGSFIHFNRDIGGNSTITLDAARTVGSFTIGDAVNAEDYTLSAGTGALSSALIFDMGLLGAGKSFLNKTQGDQDVISVRVVLNDQLNARINNGRVTMSGGIAGAGTLISTGNGILTVTGAITGSSNDLWLWHRGSGNTGAQVELGTTGASAFGNIRLGNGSFGTAGFAVLQLLENRVLSLANPLTYQGDQIGDNATVLVDAATNRWGYFKLMGGSETIGNIIDPGSALVLENMEGETINTNAVLTLGGNNLDSYVGGFIRNRSGGSGTGTLGLTKNGTGSLTLQGGNISYTGATLLNAGTLNLVNATNFASNITAAVGTRINIDTLTGTTNFDDDVVGNSVLRKVGTGTLNFNSGKMSIDEILVTAGTMLVRTGVATLRGGKNEVTGALAVQGNPGVNRALRIEGGFSVGSLNAQGLFGQAQGGFDIAGQPFSVNGLGNYAEGVLESSGEVNLANMGLRLNGTGALFNRTVQNIATNVTSVVLNDVANLIIGSVLTLEQSESTAGVIIKPDTRIVAISQNTRTVILSQAVTIPASRLVTFTYTSNTDGAIRGESLNFTDVTHDGQKFIAITGKGTVHTSQNGTLWDLRYTDPARLPFNSLAWTGERAVIVGNQGRVLTSTDGLVWTVQDVGTAIDLRGVTTTNVSFTGNLVVGSTTVSNVTSAASYLPGMPIFGFATPSSARVLTVNSAGRTVTMDSPALDTATNVDFGYFRGDTTAGNSTISQVTTAQNLQAGTAISGASIAPGTTIFAVNGPVRELTLSVNATAGGTGALSTLTGNLTLNSNTISGLSNTHGLAVGMVIAGRGIPTGTRIAALDVGAATLVLSDTVTTTATVVPLSIYAGTLTSGSPLVQNVTSLGAFTANMAARGTLVPVGTFVVSSTANTLLLSQAATGAATSGDLKASKTRRINTGTFVLNDTLVTGVTNVAGLSVGMQVSFPGVISPGTVINAINGTDVTLSLPALAPAAAQAFSAGFDLVTVGSAGFVSTSAGGATSTWFSRTSGTSRDLNSITWSESLLVGVGSQGHVITSTDGITWSHQGPPLVDTTNVILAVNTGSKTVTLNNNATVTSTQASFGAFKGDTTSGSAVITNVTGMSSLRAGMPLASALGTPPGTTIRSVNEAGFSLVMSTPATASLAAEPIRTFTGLSTNNSAIITEVRDFKGLAVGMSLHGSSITGTAAIIALDPANSRLTLATAANASGQNTFGVFYGDMTIGSDVVSNVTNLRSVQSLQGMAHLSPGKAVTPVSDFLGSGLSISSYNLAANTLALSGPASATSSGVPLLTFTGSVTDGSNLITGVSDFTGLAVNMNIFVTGTTSGSSTFFSFNIDALNPGAGTITLSGVPDVNVELTAVSVPLGIFLGTTTALSSTVTNLTNRTNQQAPSISLPDLQDVAWTGTQFVAVGNYGAVLTSPDGGVWTPRNPATGRDLQTVALSGSEILTAGQDGLILKSANGTAWSVVRAADSPALNDVRHIDQIQAVLTNGGRTLALGNGGLETTNVNTWSSSLNDTFSGSQITISIAGRTQSSGVLQISNTVTTTTTTTPQNGIVQTRNSTNRFDDAATLLSRGGDLIFANNGVNAVFSETIGKLVLGQGQLQISAFRAGLTGTSTLTFGSLQPLPGATVDFAARENVTGLVNLPGTLGVDARNRVLFTQNPVLDQSALIGGWATIDGEWATYDPIKGVMRLDPSAGYDLGDQTGWTLTDNVKMQAARTLNLRRAVNSMNIQGQTLTMNGLQLSVESGGILATTATIGTATLGNLTVGTAINVPKTLNVINSSTVTINAAITDFTVTLNAPATTVGATVVTLPNVIGLLPGMEVSGLGIPAGTRIESVDRSGTNRITLTAATTQALPASTSLTIKGGSVGLSKSGAGLLLLTNTNTYTGKTYVNNGTLRITATGSLGAAPTSFVQDQIQLNGAILQIGHVVSGTVTPLPDFNVAFNDGLRGLSIGSAGGRIEVGQAKPDNDNTNFSSAVPIVNLIISNPINALGVLELAVQAGTGNATTQFNTLTLGTALSTNTYAAGIRTEAGFEGRINLLGNNTIGGIAQEGGLLVIEGNNNFTAPIRSLRGDITINGTNTWLGTSEFEQPIDMQAGTLRLSTQTALGTGGLKLVLGGGGVLMLQGRSQTIQEIASFPLSVITNNEAPNGMVGSTNLIFDLTTNQTYSGTIKDGVTLGPNPNVAPIKLIKTGPGALTLNNAASDFSGGLEILGGALNVSSVATLSNNSAMGKATDFDPALLVIDKAVLSFAPTDLQTMDRSFTLGSGPNGAALVANGVTQIDRVTIGKEFRDPFGGNPSISTPIAFKDAGSRVLTLSGTGRGDNTLLLELRDKSISEISGLLKAGQGTWVLGKAAPFSGLTSINDGTLVVTKNDALGTAGASTVVDAVNDTFTGNLPNGTRLTFPVFFDTTLPGGVLADTAYYVVGSNSASSFQIAATPGGAALPISATGSNVKIVPKIDSFRSTVFDDVANTFTGNVPNGSLVSFNTQIVAGVPLPQPPASLLTSTVYFVKNSNGSTFEISETLNGPTFDFGSGTAGALYYTTNATGNSSGGVNLASGILELRNVNYLTPETIIFEGGSLVVPADTQSIWSGNLEVNATSTMRVGQDGQLLLNGNLLGTGFIAQEGEGTVVMRGEMLTPTTNLLNVSREYAVRAGTLVLDYALNNGSKLSDNANFRLGGSRRGGTVILSGGSHDEVVGQTVLEAGVSKIYRESGTSTLSLNNVLRSTGSSLYVDVGRIAKTDILNNNGILGAWAIIRDAVTNAFWVIPGTNSATLPVTADASTDRVSATGLVFGTLIRLTTTGVMPGGLSESTNYFVINVSPLGVTLALPPPPGQPLNSITPIVDITSPGTGTLTLAAQTSFTANPASNTFTTPGDHRLAKGSKVRLSSYGTLPGGLNAGTDYYVIDRANRSFRLSAVIDGPVVDITSSGAGVHVVQTEGAEKRVGGGALTFTVNAIAFPGAEGNGRVKVAIRPQLTSGVITSEITGSGTVSDPYIYTIKTTTDTNNNSAVLAFVKSDPNNPAVSSGKLILAESSAGGGSSDADLMADTGSYGAPTFLSNGSIDNGSKELDWASNEGAADGFIMPNGSYLNVWGPGGLTNTGVTSNISVANRETFSLRFASQNASTVSLTGVNGIRSGGILISPTVGANDSSIVGAGALTMRGEGNLQNFLIHQYNELGSLIIGSKITNRAPVARTGRLTSADRRVVAGLSVTNDLTLGMVVSGAGITNGTVISSIDPDGHTVFLSQDHSYNGARPILTFTNGPTTVTRVGTLSDGYRRRVVGVTVPAVGLNPSTISTSDLYIGMPISGPGIPVGSTITFVYNESDIEINTNHFFTGESSALTFTPTTGIEKLGPGMLVLGGDNDYTGSTYIGEGTLRAQSLTDGGLAGGLGTSNAGSGNLFFNGGTLQYVGENSRTNRGFQLSEVATINIGHERTSSVFTGAVAGTDRLQKDGSGTLIFNGNAGLESIRVEEGRLLLQAFDTNFTPGGFSASNFATTNLTSLRVAGGTLELRGTSEGNVVQNFGSQFVVEEGGSEVKVTSVAATDPNNLVAVPSFRTTSLNLMGQEEPTDVLRLAGGTVRFVENPEANAGNANIFLFLPSNARQRILPWATYQNPADTTLGGVNDFAIVESSTAGVISANTFYDIGSLYMNPGGSGWVGTRLAGSGLDVSEGGLDPSGNLRTFNGTITSRKYVNLMRYESNLNSVITINAGQTLELVSGAILAAYNVRAGDKQILGPGNITGGSANDVNGDFIMHNYNPAATFTLGANVVDRSVLVANTAGTTGKGTLKAGESLMKIESATGMSLDFFRSIRAGMLISGPGIATGTRVLNVNSDARLLLLSQAALSNQTSQIYTLVETLNFVQTGTGTTALAGTNTYSGNTYVHGGVLRLNSANAVPGGIGTSGGTSALIVEGGVVGLGLGDFTRSLGSGVSQVQFKGNGGFAAYGADRLVNLGGGATPELLRFGNNGFVPDGSSLILGSHDATHKLVFQNPIDLSAFSQAIRVEDGPVAIEAELAGGLSGLGRMIKFGLGTLRLNATSTNTGGIEVAEGRLIAADVANVFGSTAGTSGPVRLGTSYTNTTSQAALELEIEGGNVAKKLEIGAVNAASSPWTGSAQVDSNQGLADLGQHVSMLAVEGYPAMAYYDAENADLKYVRALDARGARWGVPVTVSSRNNVGKYPSLSLINGNPAISYYDETNGSLMYVRATDAPGVFWGTPIPVLAQAAGVLTVAVQSDGKVLVGGFFTQIDGVDKNRIIRLETDGSLDPTFEAFVMNGEIRDILIQSDGKIVIGGTFTTVRVDGTSANNVTRNRIARLNPNGTLDTAFDPNLNGDVRVLAAQPDGRILVGGSFTAVGSTTRARMARLTASGSLDSTFISPDIRNGEVRAIAQEPAGTFVIGGNFTSVKGDNNRNRLARISNDARNLNAFNPDANGDVNAIALLPGGKLLVGGSFGAFAGGVISRTRLARLETTGAVDLTFAQEVNGTVNRLQLESSGDVLVAGLFTQLGDFTRNFFGRVKADGTVDAAFDPNPDQEVRDMFVMTDSKIVLGGLFIRIIGQTQQVVARISSEGVPDVGFGRNIINVGKYSSLLFVNGVPAISFYDVLNGELEYARANDVNGGSWSASQVLDASVNDVGVGISMIIANIGGDLLTKDNRGTNSATDDEVTLSGTAANIGTPVIAYGDATNNVIKYVVAINATGTGLAAPLTNWSSPVVIPGTGAVGAHFTLSLVDKFPAIAYQESTTQDLKFIRALNVAGITNNLRDPDTLEILKIPDSALTFSAATSWGAPITLDSAGDVGQYPSLALVNGQPTTPKDRPAISYYDATNGDLKYVVAPESTGTLAWGAPTVLVAPDDVGRFTSLAMVNGLPAIGYYNATLGDLEFLILNDASGYSRLSFDGDTTWSGAVALNGSLMIAPTSGQTTSLTGVLSGPAGFKLITDGILNLSNAANNFGTSLAMPGVTTGPGTAVNGAAIIRSGSLHVSRDTALGVATVELGDALPQEISADRATNFTSVLAKGGRFIALHDGRNFSDTGSGAFVKVGATVDGQYYGLVATTTDAVTDRLTGNLPAGTQIQLIGETLPPGTQADTPYYVLNPSGTDFEISLTLGGTRVGITPGDSIKVYYIETAKLNAQILVKDEASNPERNGIYRFIIDPDNFSLSVGVMNLARVATFDSPGEMLYGVRASVQNGTSAGDAYFLASNVIDLNYSAVHWVEDRLNTSVALLATVADMTISNPVDVNAVSGTGTSILGAHSSVTSGLVNFTGAVTLQNQRLATQEVESLTLTSSTSTGLGLVLSGVISEADGGVGVTKDRLSLIKTGSGISTLNASNTFSGGISINEGTLLVMNTTGSATGTGAVTVLAGATLGGNGSINSAVTLAGAPGNLAILRPGDPTASSSPVETLTINQPLTINANSVVEFTLGATNFTKLAGTSISLTTATSRLLVQLESGYLPTLGTEFDLLDFTSLSIQGGALNLLNLLQLPVATVWDTTQFLTTGKIVANGDAEPTAVTGTLNPQTIQQGANATFSIVGAYTGTAPISFQWTLNNVDIAGATSETFTVTGANQLSEGDYRVRVINPVNPSGATSNAAALTVDWPLSFAINLPTTRLGSVGSPITFSVTMNGEETSEIAITYQWQKGTTDIDGATDSSYTIPIVSVTDTATYRVIVKGPFNPAGMFSNVCSFTASPPGPAVVLESPISQTLLVGSPLNLSATPGGDNNARVKQWRRNAVAIPGENADTLVIPNITLAQAGDYTYKLDNKVISTGKTSTNTSAAARVVVVENPNKIVAAQLGKITTLTVNVAGPSAVVPRWPTYRWLKNGLPVPGDGRFTNDTTKTLSIKNLVHTDTDVYTCRVEGAPGTAAVIGGTHFLRVYDAAPKFPDVLPSPPQGIVGGAYSWKIPVTSDSGLPADVKRTPSTYAVTGLPPGLKVDATTGYITGRPTAANPIKTPLGYPITITISNAVLPKASISTVISISALPAGIAGIFAGPIDRDPVLNGNLGGRFDLIVTTTGAISGKVALGSAAARSFVAANGTLDIDVNNILPPQGRIFLPATTTLPSLTISFKLAITAGTVPTTLLSDATIIAGTSAPVTFQGWRNNWAAAAVANVSAKADAYAGLYTFGMALGELDPLVTNPTLRSLVPQGTGYASFTVVTAGTYTLAGRTADNVSFTGSYFMGPTGQSFVFQTLYTSTLKGSLLGTLQIDRGLNLTLSDDNDLSGNLTWVCPPNSATANRLYRAGFGTTTAPVDVRTPVNLVAFGGRYIAPVAATLSNPNPTVLLGLELDPGTLPPRNAELIFSEDGDLPANASPILDPYPSDVVDNLNPNISLTILKASALDLPKLTANPASTKLTATAATGAISGSFSLSAANPQSVAPNPVLRTPVAFFGQIVRDNGVQVGVGFVIIPQLPRSGTGETPATTPQLSGRVLFQAK